MGVPSPFSYIHEKIQIFFVKVSTRSEVTELMALICLNKNVQIFEDEKEVEEVEQRKSSHTSSLDVSFSKTTKVESYFP